ncbi:TLC domain-containing protein [Ditylenchus destructor]|uniref:TLC domain-containing protein n=1 Tax=Ditylenchus destructor TaxID=166010 RepID=A0AAD4NK53_9BILA|nr:TLC domain-containing protein [Ditylenchus destructor]
MKSPGEWTRSDWEELGRSIGFIILSLLLFGALQFAVRWYLFHKCTFRTFSYFKTKFIRKKNKRRLVPDSQSLQVIPPNKKWRISNEVVSLIHSVISGSWALYACLMFPKLISHMDTFVDQVPKSLIYLSFGYLVHDLIDLLINERSVRIIELLFHHVIVLTAFFTTLTTHQFLGVVMFGLLMELNSIFLHTRSLMNLYGQPKNSTAFKFVALLNIASFMVFRMAVSLYLLFWQITNALSMEWYLTIITFVVIVSLSITNTVLLYRVLAADGLLGTNRQRNSTIPSAQSSQPADETEDDLNFEEHDESTSDDDGTDIENGARSKSYKGVHNSAQNTAEHVDECVGTEMLDGNRRESISRAVQTPNGIAVNGNASYFSTAVSETTSLTSPTHDKMLPNSSTPEVKA